VRGGGPDAADACAGGNFITDDFVPADALRHAARPAPTGATVQ